jgi:hypothetical protein
VGGGADTRGAKSHLDRAGLVCIPHGYAGCHSPAAGARLARGVLEGAPAERWVRMVRSEVTDRMVIAGQRHLRAVLDEYAAHCNQHRPNRACDLRLPRTNDGLPAVANMKEGQVRCRRILGGLINEPGSAPTPPNLSLLPGLLAATRIRLPPAGDDELMNTKIHHGITSRLSPPALPGARMTEVPGVRVCFSRRTL